MSLLLGILICRLGNNSFIYNFLSRSSRLTLLALLLGGFGRSCFGGRLGICLQMSRLDLGASGLFAVNPSWFVLGLVENGFGSNHLLLGVHCLLSLLGEWHLLCLLSDWRKS